jgi:PTS system nitrogen regulatory IIA component
VLYKLLIAGWRTPPRRKGETPPNTDRSDDRRGTVLNRLASVLDVDDIVVEAAALDTRALFVLAGAILARHVAAGGSAAIAEALDARERLSSTALGQGVAIPHGRVKGLATTCAAVLRLRQPLAFGAPDETPTRLFVFLLVAEHASQGDLDTLAQTAEMLSERAVRERLMQSPDARALHATIADWRSKLAM